jgi:hypothetical protein
MSAILLPTDTETLAPITAALDQATPAARVAWARSLNGAQQARLFRLAEGQRCTATDLTDPTGGPVRAPGRNGLAAFHLFAKVFAAHAGVVVGYNDNREQPLAGLVGRVTGPGHFTAYDAPDGSGEVYIDYRRVPTTTHPDFPPLMDNESGLRALVFGDMVDVVRRVSQHVFIGDAFKGRFPRDTPAPLLCRIGRLLGTAPFVICRPE